MAGVTVTVGAVGPIVKGGEGEATVGGEGVREGEEGVSALRAVGGAVAGGRARAARISQVGQRGGRRQCQETHNENEGE